MNLEDLINRKCPPEPWEDGDKIPWYDPGFSERMLKERFWNESQRATTTRYFLIYPSSSSVTAYASSSQAYTDEEFHSLLEECGFPTVTRYPSLTGDDEGTTPGVFVLRAEKGGPQ